MSALIDQINSYVWSSALIVLCLAAGLYFSVVTRFLQLRHISHMIGSLMGARESKVGVSSFQALALSISGRVGVGNIAGVATAIGFGGPGAIFWMWVIAFLGAGTAFIESTLAQMYKIEQDGQYRGGPAYYIERALGWKWYSVIFAIATIVAVGFLLPGIQANAIASGMQNAFNFDPVWVGSILAIVLGLIIFGGVKRISHVAEFVVPFMAVAYVAVALTIIVMNWDRIPEVLVLIFSSAFGAHATFGGIIGAAVSWGVKRGIYSNEAGQGTGPHAAAAAEVSHPAKQGLVQSFSVYIDTLFVCTATAFMILIAGTYNVHGEEGMIIENLGQVEVGPYFTQMAVENMFSGFGSPFVAVALLFFAFTTLMAYYYIAETNVAYLTQKMESKWLIFGLRCLILVSVVYGSLRTASTAWALGDLGVGVMAWLNVIAILILRKPALAALVDYEKQLKEGKNPTFNPTQFGIKDEQNIWLKASENPSSPDELPKKHAMKS
ncbi:MAG: alanine/glycine:cation symporter family protein [Oligoflexus sp.]